MRFSLLPIGESFEFQNDRYCKNGPLTAVNLATNRQRMIPRSALVQSESATQSENPAEPVATTLDARRVITAFSQYHEACLELLTTDNPDQTAREEKLASLRQQFLADCGLE